MQSLTNKIIALKFKDNTKKVDSVYQQQSTPTQPSYEKLLSQLDKNSTKNMTDKEMLTGFLIW